jgi:hypothetical protein
MSFDLQHLVVLINSLIVVFAVTVILLALGFDFGRPAEPEWRRLSPFDHLRALGFFLANYPPFFLAVMFFSLAGTLFLFPELLDLMRGR